ncbi:hypothetical protein HMPREF3212_00364 [Citrobacter freundii]|nr:hypothetical protein AB07_1070 [Citrobacter freundii]KWZ93282.1 hypothetical protein HMPREF3212_00364 [Citrobacter freundii]
MRLDIIRKSPENALTLTFIYASVRSGHYLCADIEIFSGILRK